ncbi:hypothetical protein HMPREF9628_00120 [Peptoanaerobacter stomatis]|uniref:Ribonuclease n=1 Tax=Peptoanaerobacter stomatis TaxID=796937 RepID=G9XA29_9FIRM|nr:hypothetical protein HMPREF9628_00120 [Peptoanaerobacter stomatis]
MEINELLKQNSKFIKNFVSNIEFEQYPYYINQFSLSEKKSIQNIGISMSKKLDKLEKEKLRIQDMYEYEKNIKISDNINNVLCLDEVGRGPLAGPVVVCGVMLENNPNILYVNDSKKLSEEKRKDIYSQIIKKIYNIKQKYWITT